MIVTRQKNGKENQVEGFIHDCRHFGTQHIPDFVFVFAMFSSMFTNIQ